MFACFFETNFHNIPFFKPRLLSFFAGSVVFVFCLDGVRFCLSVSMLVLFLVLFLLCFLSCFLFCFLSCFLFCFQSMNKTLFSL